MPVSAVGVGGATRDALVSSATQVCATTSVRADPALSVRFDAVRAGDRPSDLATFKKILDGTLSAEDGLVRIARSDGWPIRTPNGFLVACLDQGQVDSGVAGDFGNWKPLPMQRQAGVFWREIPAGTGPTWRYKLVAGDQYFADPLARRYAFDDFGEVSLARSPGGHVERWPAMTDGTVPARTVRIWVPAQRASHHLYAHDGQNLFGQGWYLDRAAGPRTLVIGIDNTPSRFEEYTFSRDLVEGQLRGGGAVEYTDFVEKWLRPFVERHYGKPKRVGLMGSSLGGHVSLFQDRRYPDRYDFVASLSGTVDWGRLEANNPTLEDLFAQARPGRAAIYLDTGGGPDGSDNYPANRRLADALAARGWVWQKTLWHWWQPNAAHNEPAWAARVARPLRLFEAM